MKETESSVLGMGTLIEDSDMVGGGNAHLAQLCGQYLAGHLESRVSYTWEVRMK